MIELILKQRRDLLHAPESEGETDPVTNRRGSYVGGSFRVGVGYLEVRKNGRRERG